MKNFHQDRIKKAEEIARKAGDLLMQIFKNRLEIKNEIKGVNDVVTNADIKSEKLITNLILKNFPQDLVISEEKDFSFEHSSEIEHKYTWIIDPLDGTRNFSIGNPNFVVSIGILKNKEIIGGGVYYPILDQYFVAKEGKSFNNGEQMKIKFTDLENVIVGFWDKREKDPNYYGVDIINKLRGKVKVLRMFSASALEKS